MIDYSNYLTIEQAAYQLGISSATVRRKIKKGIISAVTIAGKYKIAPEQVQKLIA